MGWLEDLAGLDDLAEGLGFGDLAGLDDLEGLGGLERLTGLAFFFGRLSSESLCLRFRLHLNSPHDPQVGNTVANIFNFSFMVSILSVSSEMSEPHL